MACPDFPLWHLDTEEKKKKKWPGFKEEENSCWREQPRAGGRGDLLRVFIPRQPRGYRSCSALIHPLCPLPEPSKPGSSCGIRPRCHLLSSPCPALSWDRAMAWRDLPAHPVPLLPPSQAAPSPSYLVLGTSREGESTASLGNPSQGFSALPGKNLSQISHPTPGSFVPNPLLTPHAPNFRGGHWKTPFPKNPSCWSLSLPAKAFPGMSVWVWEGRKVGKYPGVSEGGQGWGRG